MSRQPGGSRRRGRRRAWLLAAEALAVARTMPLYFSITRDTGPNGHGVTFIPWTVRR